MPRLVFQLFVIAILGVGALLLLLSVGSAADRPKTALSEYRRSKRRLCLYILAAIAFTYGLVSNDSPGSVWQWLFDITLLCILVSEVRRFRVLRKQLPAAPPSLRNQLFLILLPVIALAVVGWIGIRREQHALEAELQQRAQEITAEVAKRYAESVAGQLHSLAWAGSEWASDGTRGATAVYWPGESASGWGRSPFSGNTAAQDPVFSRFAGTNPAVVFPLRVDFDLDGRLIEPTPYPAAPIAVEHWTSNSTVPLREEWAVFVDAIQPGRSPAQASEALKRFKDLAPSPSTRLQAEWMFERTQPVGTPDEVDRVTTLGHYAVNARAQSETGLPLGGIILAELLRRHPDLDLTFPTFSLARALTLEQPSLLTPWILDQLPNLARWSNSSDRIQVVTELRQRWEAQERLRALAGILATRIQIRTNTAQELWIQGLGTEWWVSLGVGTRQVRIRTKNSGHTEVHPSIKAFFIPKIIIGELSASTLQQILSSSARLPAGTKLSLDFPGTRVNLPFHPSLISSSDPAPVLAQSEDRLPWDLDSIGASSTARPNSTRSEFPPFTVRLHLTDRAALFAAQRRQQLWFGGMILLTAAVAGFGAWQTQRAFSRQLAINEQKSNFVSAVSHELRAPLASLRLLAEGLADGRVENEPKRREYARFIVQETRRLGTLVENVLGLARVDAGRNRYEFAPIDLTRLVRDTSQQLQLLAADRGVSLDYQGPDPEASPVELVADGAALQQALTNLIDNAIKHAPVGTGVTVTFNPPVSGSVAIRVQDQGPGIPLEDHERIFERFFRRGSELRRETQGVGLGLTLVREIASAHGGTIHVESEPGKGATFILSLPVERRDS